MQATQWFTNEQMDWLRLIKEHIVSSYHIELDDLDFTPFDGQGGKGKCSNFLETKWMKLLMNLTMY